MTDLVREEINKLAFEFCADNNYNPSQFLDDLFRVIRGHIDLLPCNGPRPRRWVLSDELWHTLESLPEEVKK